VDELELLIFQLVNALLQSLPGGNYYAVGILDTVITGNLWTGQNKSYSISINQPIPNGPSLVASIVPSLAPFFAPLNPNRINAAYFNGDIYVYVVDPAEVTVTFSATGSDLFDAREPILSMAGLVNGSGDPLVTLGVNGSLILVTFQQDAANYGTTIYRTSACQFYRALFNATLSATFETLSNRTIDRTSIVTTDPECNTSVVLSPLPGSTTGATSTATSTSTATATATATSTTTSTTSTTSTTNTASNLGTTPNANSAGTIAAIVVVVVLIVAIIVGVYVYKKWKKRKDNNEKTVQEL